MRILPIFPPISVYTPVGCLGRFQSPRASLGNVPIPLISSSVSVQLFRAAKNSAFQKKGR